METLSTEHLDWLREEAQETFGLTPARAKILVAVLARERFGMLEISRLVRIRPDNLRIALDFMTARELIEVRLISNPRTPKPSAFQATPGKRLLAILSALRVA
jgi:hypothetical protein